MSKLKDEVRMGRHVTWVGFWTNVGLSAFKILAGIFGRSSAMIADGIHSASDLLTDVVVLVVIGVSRRKADSSHSYGHGKIETFATFIIALLLGAVGIGIFIDGLERVIRSLGGETLPRPGWIALGMAVVSIIAKEWLFRYTMAAARRIKSSALEANAWHHRSDALSSLATTVGIAGAMFLGVRWRILDPVAAMFVSVLIVVMAWRLASGAVKELVEASLPREVTDRMKHIIVNTPGVKSFHELRTRRNGNRMIVDVHIKVDPQLTIVEGHDIATEVEVRLRDAFSPISVNIHIEPYFEKNGNRCEEHIHNTHES